MLTFCLTVQAPTTVYAELVSLFAIYQCRCNLQFFCPHYLFPHPVYLITTSRTHLVHGQWCHARPRSCNLLMRYVCVTRQIVGYATTSCKRRPFVDDDTVIIVHAFHFSTVALPCVVSTVIFHHRTCTLAASCTTTHDLPTRATDLTPQFSQTTV